MRSLKFEFLDAKAEWVEKWDVIRCRVALQNQVQTVEFGGIAEFCVQDLLLGDKMHVVVQWDNLVLSSQAFLIGKILGKEFGEVFEDEVQLQVSDENIEVISKQSAERFAVRSIGVKIRVQMVEMSEGKWKDGTDANSEVTDTDVRNEELKSENTERSSELGVRVLADLERSCGEVGVRVLADMESVIPGFGSEKKAVGCKYTNRMYQIEENIRKGKNRLEALKASLGGDFEKILGEARKRESRSPTRSPGRSRGSGLATPFVTQRSMNTSIISMFRGSEDNFIEIPGKIEVTLDQLSIQNKESLIQSIFAMVGKKTFTNACLQDLNQIVLALKQQESSVDLMNNAYQATVDESEAELANLELLIQNTQAKNESISASIASVCNKTKLFVHEKQKLELDLKNISQENEEIKQKFKKSEILNEIKSLEAAQNKLEKFRTDIEENLISNIESTQIYQQTLIKELQSLADEKAEHKTAYTKILIELERAEFENSHLSKELSVLQTHENHSNELLEILQTLNTSSNNNSDSVDSLKRQIIQLRSSKLETTTDSQHQVQKLDKDNKSLSLLQSSYQKFITQHTDSLTETQKKFKPISQTINQLEDLYSKKFGIESSFEQSLKKLKQIETIDSNILQEVNYFSDFVFSVSQGALHHQRIAEQVKQLLQSKNIEFDALKAALKILKSQHPVYTPIAGDYLDEALSFYLNSREGCLELPFVRDSYGVYYFGTKKVMLSQERNKLIVKTGGGYLPIDQFIDTYLVPELDKQLRAREALPEAPKAILEYNCDTPIIEEDI